MQYASAPDELFAWRLTDHVCRVCFGRILERMQTTPDGVLRIVRCANCATELHNVPVKELCCCGLKTSTGKDAGLRCRRNDQPTPEQPAELAVAFGEPQVVRTPRPRLRPDAAPGPKLGLE